MSSLPEVKEVYIAKEYNLTLTHDYKSLKFGSGWGETCTLPVVAGMVVKEEALKQSRRVFNIAKNLTKLDVMDNKERIKKILGINDEQFKEITDDQL